MEHVLLYYTAFKIFVIRQKYGLRFKIWPNDVKITLLKYLRFEFSM